MPDQNEADKARGQLAAFITVVSVAGVITLAIIIVVTNTPARALNGQWVLGTVLPVIGTWVGTILAFYFGKANFESAANFARQLTPQDKLRVIPVKTKWIPRDAMFFKTAPIDALKISAVLDEMDKLNKGDRLPVLTDKFVANYVIHRSELDQYIATKARKNVPGTADLTFGDFFKECPDREKMFATSFGTVKSDATLADAQVAMQQTKNCEDVFVTADGTPAGEVLGWITDNIIQANLQA